MSWQQNELMGYAYYAGKGYRILVPVVQTNGYDFVAERDGVFVRVNVKTAGLKSKTNQNSWSISQSSGGFAGHHENPHVDVYLTWLPKEEKFIELGGDFFVGGNSKSKLIPKNLILKGA